jgi:uncharacterized membrane protein (UPF0136 family)
MADQRLASILFFVAAAVYMAFVARGHLRGVRPRSVLAMALAWLLIILGLFVVASWMGWERR